MRNIRYIALLAIISMALTIPDADAVPQRPESCGRPGGQCIIINEDIRPPVEDRLNCSYFFAHPQRIDNYNDLTWQNQPEEYNPSAAKYCAGRKVNDAVSSLTNASDAWVVFAEHAGVAGRLFCAPPWTESRDLRKFKGANDIFSAHVTSTSPPANCTWTAKDPVQH